MRTAPGKDNCLVLDYGENVERHGPIDQVRPKRAGEKRRTKDCPECDSVIDIAAQFCPDCKADLRRKKCQKCSTESHITATHCTECGHDFSPIAPKLQTIAKVRPEASDLDPISSGAEPAPEWREVEEMSLNPWKKAGSPDSVRVSYSCGFRDVSEWTCPAHGGYATTKFRQWWLKMGASMPFPTTAEEAIERSEEVKVPSRILVARDGKYDRVAEHDMKPRERTVIADEDIPF
jgi:DNA repair protein RadD